MTDPSYVWLTEMSQHFLDKDYLLPGQTVDERITIIAERAASILKDHSFVEKFKTYMRRGWFSLSTPIWSNFGTDRGLPISCFGSMIEDNMESIFSTLAEVGMMTKHGGGTSIYSGKLRPRGSVVKNNGESSGSVNFLQLYDTTMNVVSQGNLRRGSLAAYTSLDHKDIMEFLSMRSEGHPIQNLSFGVTVSDEFMKDMIAGDQEKRKIWAKVIETRLNTGYPYILFEGNANKNKPDVYLKEQMHIYASNLCTEIFLPSSETESFVCDLSSMNILHYDEWKDTDAPEVLVYLLDAVMTEFIQKARKIKFLERAVRFAENHRALGVGWLGYHSYLQSKMIPFESFEAKMFNIQIARTIHEKTLQASKHLAEKFGEPILLKGYGRRNTTLQAIAPTKSSAFILGQVSEGIEPHRSNYYIKDLAKGKFTIKNKHLEALLIEKGQNTEEVWNSILKNRGSIQHLSDLFSPNELLVFKTFSEISPKEIVIQAGARQRFIDQGQSLNLIIPPTTPVKDINTLYILAWELGVKSLYYQISVNAAQELNRSSILDCVSCSA